MKKTLIISIIAFVALFFVTCEKSDPLQEAIERQKQIYRENIETAKAMGGFWKYNEKEIWEVEVFDEPIKVKMDVDSVMIHGIFKKYYRAYNVPWKLKEYGFSVSVLTERDPIITERYLGDNGILSFFYENLWFDRSRDVIWWETSYGMIPTKEVTRITEDEFNEIYSRKTKK